MCAPPICPTCMCANPCASQPVYSPLMCISLSACPNCLSHLVYVPLGLWVPTLCPTRCLSHSVCARPGVCPARCMSHSVCVPLGVYPTRCLCHSVCPTRYVSHLVFPAQIRYAVPTKSLYAVRSRLTPWLRAGTCTTCPVPSRR